MKISEYHETNVPPQYPDYEGSLVEVTRQGPKKWYCRAVRAKMDSIEVLVTGVKPTFLHRLERVEYVGTDDYLYGWFEREQVILKFRFFGANDKLLTPPKGIRLCAELVYEVRRVCL